MIDNIDISYIFTYNYNFGVKKNIFYISLIKSNFIIISYYWYRIMGNICGNEDIYRQLASKNP